MGWNCKKKGHDFNGESPYCAECGKRLMSDEEFRQRKAALLTPTF